VESPKEAEEKRLRAEREAKRNEARALADQARRADQLSERVALATRAIETDPYAEEGYAVRAGAYDQMGFCDAALKDLSSAMELTSNPLPYRVQRAEIARRLGRVEDEVRELGEAIRLDDKSADLFHRRGTARFVARDYLGAIADWERAVQIDPSLGKTLEPRLRKAREALNP
jgi:tetratricopeptide (TPR) repeat protein